MGNTKKRDMTYEQLTYFIEVLKNNNNNPVVIPVDILKQFFNHQRFSLDTCIKDYGNVLKEVNIELVKINSNLIKVKYME